MPWPVYRHLGSVHELHHLDVAGRDGHRSLHVMVPTEPGVALGSAQSEAILDRSAVVEARRAVTRRHSGGGLVALDPSNMLWVDVVIPAGDPLWKVDVAEAFVWLGRAWATAVSEHPDAGSPGSGTAGPVRVHRGVPTRRELGSVVCFAGVASGEVTVGGAKVVGMSQRRTRQWARFQCLVHRGFDADETLRLLDRGEVGEQRYAELAHTLGDSVASVSDLEAVFEAFRAALPGS